jgi:hypothetical protein
VVPFLGVSETLFPFCIISPWLPNGNIVEYTKKNREANRFQLVSDHRNLHSQIVSDFVLDSSPKLPVVLSIYIH